MSSTSQSRNRIQTNYPEIFVVIPRARNLPLRASMQFPAVLHKPLLLFLSVLVSLFFAPKPSLNPNVGALE